MAPLGRKDTAGCEKRGGGEGESVHAVSNLIVTHDGGLDSGIHDITLPSRRGE
jgi:hypothetical protein